MLLFAVAYYAERKERSGNSIVNNPYIYSISLAVYCTSWTFYGSVGKAATSGLSFMAIYLGPTLMASVWMIVLRKVVRTAKTNRITSVADFIGARYGKSLVLSAIVTCVAVFGITPYLGLQIKAITTTFTIISGDTSGSVAAGIFITFILGAFAIIFGARRLDSSERHGGLVFAIAFESIVKLAAFVLVGLFVTFRLFNGPNDIFGRIHQAHHEALLLLGPGSATGYFEWSSLICLSMMAVMFLPRQFQMSVVENYDEDHISKAAWLFPLYLFLINVFVLPIAFGGILTGGSEKGADYFVLTLPLTHGARYLSLMAFIGGFSAATGMIIVEAIALSTMVMNSIVMPAVINFHDAPRFPTVILNIKRLVIMAIVFLGYSFTTSVGGFYSLVDMGLISFEAVSLFAPSFFLGLYWKRGTKAGAITGLAAGFSVWFYTLILPVLIEAGIVRNIGLVAQMTGSWLLNPDRLFGINGMGKWGGSFFWSMLANLLTYLVVSVFSRQSKEEELQAIVFVESYEKARDLARGGSYSIEDIEEVLTQCLGSDEAAAAVNSFLKNKNKHRYELAPHDINELRNVAENVLSGAMGSSMAAIIFENKLVLTDKERVVLSESIKNITETLRLSRQELADANKELFYLKEFSENIIESASIGIATVDEFCRVKYWNRALETITSISKAAASDKSLNLLLPWLSCNLLIDDEDKESVFETPDHRTFKMNVSPFKDPSGGHVVIVDDITEKKVMEEQLLQSSKLASIGKLTAGISHEIGNPLASISSLVQELRAADIDTAEAKEFAEESLKVINSHVERIAKIVRSLSDFARMSSTKKISCSLTEILDRTVNLVKYDKRFKQVRLITNVGKIPALLVNPDQIQQVFLNLMLNALDAMPDGGALTITMQQDGPSLKIVFADTGSGIDESAMDKVFDPFFTTKPLGKGTGLGLSICYGIIREHKGTIDFSSRKGEGTSFTIRLPLKSDG